MSDRRKALIRRKDLKARTLKPVRPNAGAEARYRKRLQDAIREMNRSVQYWLRAKYRANTPKIAQDDIPARELERAIKKLSRRWQKQFDELAPKLAEYFSRSAEKRSSAVMRKLLKDHGFTVEFRMTAAMRDVMQASIAEQVSLIKSIPEKYFTDVQGSVMRAVQNGRDLPTLTDDLQKNYGVAYRRAAFIARDQVNKANASMTRVRQKELGITEAVWLHSHAGKEPRPTHVAMDGKKYDVEKGMYDPAVGKFVFPGELPNCRCLSRSVIPGLS
jgi:SPP1 gp7 family putative phage head morphogenesis protein